MAIPRQERFIGFSLNAQGALDYLLGGHPGAKTARKITHGLFEVFNLPFTSVRVLESDHSPCPTCLPEMGGA
jgi:hypothetical protein